ncbi:MAG: AraC family transcriptional regulator [Sediminicola sp.]
MKVTDIRSCYIGPEISPEQFIAEHIFLYLAKGRINGYDGNTKQTLNAGEYHLLVKNRLARYSKEKIENEFEKVVIIFDEVFLKKFQEKHGPTVVKHRSEKAFLKLDESELIPNFVRSLAPYYNGSGKIDKAFADIKREELLIILLKNRPELTGIFFDFGIPEKINLEGFMNKNFKFNVSIQRLAYMTGRSLSAFKRDFKEIFNETPKRWLVQKRLQEAHFLIDKKKKRPTDIYLELGFQDLSHFSYAFKKQFGLAPTELSNK